MMKASERLQTVVAELKTIGCPLVASKLIELYRAPEFLTMDPLTLLTQLIDEQYEANVTKSVNGRLRRAGLEGCATVLENCRDTNARTYLPDGSIAILSELVFVAEGMNLCIVGPSGSGKTYLAKAFGTAACQQWRVLYSHCETLLARYAELKEKSNGDYVRKLSSLANLDLLIIDDFLLQPLSSKIQTSILFDILDRRVEKKHSTIVCSQRSPESWTATMGDDIAIGDAVTRRATSHYTVVIELRPTT